MSYVVTITDINDAETISTAFASFYLNSGCRAWERFYDEMIRESRNVVYNFTALCVNWFMELSRISCYDDRNRASVMIAQKMAASGRFAKLSYRVHKKAPTESFSVDAHSHADMAKMFSRFMRANSADRYGKTPQDYFLEKMMLSHRTLQQNYSRFCFGWFDYLGKHNGRGGEHIRLARTAAKFREALPFI